MRIAQLAAPWIAVPPKGYGGAERIVYFLTEELVRRGHKVTLFATGDSKSSGQLSPFFPKALGNDGTYKSAHPFMSFLQCSSCFERAAEFDVIHNHLQYQTLFFTDFVKTPVVHTLHGSFNINEVAEDRRLTLSKFKHQDFVSISNAQRANLPDLNYIATVYNGIKIEEFEFSFESGNYLAWLGRITPKKGVTEAIKVARALGMKLKIAAFIDPVDRDFFEKEVKPLIDGRFIEFVGELDSRGKSDFLKNALCVLFPISWHEPFGMVMVEAMTTGTPVIAFNFGSVPEIVINGVTGFVVENIGEMIEKVKEIGKIDRGKCRKHVEDNFTVEKMVKGYEEVYEKILDRSLK